ncbi:DUF5689 domain-containing protein [Croceiramulus getboli]|nr:DUF5689 domain-containing protein [Flavobacteriaceae bacterium YJPT1-3]
MRIKLPVWGVFALFFLFSQFINGQSIFINELHYDNEGTDVNEAFEIAGPAGTDLANWSMVLYNGSNSSPYNTVALSGVLPNQSNGFGTLIFTLPSNGLQNGAPDGLALVDAMGGIVQFLSYEGVITAAAGPAIGLTSTAIPVAESSSTPVGASLTLTGSGNAYTDFSWEAVAMNSYGAINTNQAFVAQDISPRINEFVFNHTGSDVNEFVEVLANPDTDLSNLFLLEIEGDGNSPGTIDEVIQLGTTSSAGYFTTPLASNTFENGTLTLLLVTDFTGNLGDDIDVDDDGVIDNSLWNEIIDEVGVNDGGADDLNYGTSTLFQNYDGISFTVGGASRIPNGVDTNDSSDWVRNDFDGTGLPAFPEATAEEGEALNTPGTANAVQDGDGGGDPDPIQLLINEIDADTEGTDTMEFIELYDGGVGNASLNGYAVVFYNGSNDSSYAVYDLDGFSTNASGYFVIGNADVPRVDLVISGNGIQNGADAAAIYTADASDFPNGTAVTLDNLVDAVVYDTNDSDDSGLLVLLNSGDQLNEDALGAKDVQSLQRFPNGSGDLQSTLAYVNAIPTPGAANTNATEPIPFLINELDADTPGSDTEEFVELFDGGIGNQSLDGFSLVLYNGSSDTVYQAFDLSGQTTDDNGYFVLGGATVLNVDLVVNNGFLQNGADAVALYRAPISDFPNGTGVILENLIDAVVYDTSDSDDAELLVLLNAGEPQVDENANGNGSTESIQRMPNGDGGALNTSTFMAATPTPGIANDGIVEPGEIITIASAREAADGITVTITGVLTVADEFGGPAYLQDQTAGIAIFDEAVHGDGVFAIGDSITVTGTRSSFNSLIQLSPAGTVTAEPVPQQPIIPRLITLSELSAFSGELVTIENVSFPNPGDLLFGNSNIVVTDASGSAELRIDGNVEDLVGRIQPGSCTITGVVSRFNDLFQILPRKRDDLPCAEEFVPPGDQIPVAKTETFDVVTWNIEWFGDEANSPAAGSPMSDAVQRDSVATILRGLDADVYAVQEIADDALFAELVALLPGYDFILSDAVSRPDGEPPFQRVGFIYNTTTVTPLATRPLLETIHPLYNGGDDSFLVNYPSETDRFYASGRLPFLMTANVTINGVEKEMDLVALHARANSSNDPQNRYDMRKYDVEVLKDSLDTQFSNRNLILLGDYNDDVDETVADITSTVSSYVAYTNDATNYNIVSSALSDQGLRSFVFRENMIDHIAITDELFENYLEESVTVHYEFYDNDYTRTASDHFPVSARFQLESLTISEVNTINVSCAGAEDGTATVSVQGGFAPYVYSWSDGQTTAAAVGLSAGIYTVTVTDALGQTFTSEDIVIEAPEAIAFTLNSSGTVFNGYEPASCATLSVSGITGGDGQYSVSWSTGATEASIDICPTETTTYEATVTDASGCTLTQSVTVEVIDVSCGNNDRNPKVSVCFRGRSLCISPRAVPSFLRRGATLGDCGTGTAVVTELAASPNPTRGPLTITVTNSKPAQVEIAIYGFGAVAVQRIETTMSAGQSEISADLSDQPRGLYLIHASVNGQTQKTIRVIKR